MIYIITIYFIFLIIFIQKRKSFCGYGIIVNGDLINLRLKNGLMIPAIFKSIEEGLRYIKKKGFDISSNLNNKNKVLLVKLFHNKKNYSFEMGKVCIVGEDE